MPCKFTHVKKSCYLLTEAQRFEVPQTSDIEQTVKDPLSLERVMNINHHTSAESVRATVEHLDESYIGTRTRRSVVEHLKYLKNASEISLDKDTLLSCYQLIEIFYGTEGRISKESRTRAQELLSLLLPLFRPIVTEEDPYDDETDKITLQQVLCGESVKKPLVDLFASLQVCQFGEERSGIYAYGSLPREDFFSGLEKGLKDLKSFPDFKHIKRILRYHGGFPKTYLEEH